MGEIGCILCRICTDGPDGRPDAKKQGETMVTERQIDQLEWEMIRFNEGDPKRIHHLIKVHQLARLIGRMEGLDEHTQFLTECAALVHDIGIRPAEEKYGACDGKLQEREGPSHAGPLLERVGLNRADVERICFLVAHHHTYTGIAGADYQILVEADFLVNFYEDALSPQAIQAALNGIFRTESGKALCRMMYHTDNAAAPGEEKGHEQT